MRALARRRGQGRSSEAGACWRGQGRIYSLHEVADKIRCRGREKRRCSGTSPAIGSDATSLMAMMRRALFLDRDGVLDELVWHAATDEWGAPLAAAEMTLRPGVLAALAAAREAGWLLFVVTNQPDAAKGKTSQESLQEVHQELVRQLGHLAIDEFFYCFHQASDGCDCRKPSPRFVLEAARRHGIDLSHSWFVGDSDSDVECGIRAGCRTALIQYEHSSSKRGAQRADLVCEGLRDFVTTLVRRSGD